MAQVEAACAGMAVDVAMTLQIPQPHTLPLARHGGESEGLVDRHFAGRDVISEIPDHCPLRLLTYVASHGHSCLGWARRPTPTGLSPRHPQHPTAVLLIGMGVEAGYLLRGEEVGTAQGVGSQQHPRRLHCHGRGVHHLLG